MGCAYCDEGALLDEFGIKICELKASKVYLFKEQSHRGRCIVASKFHVSEMIDLDRRARQEFMDDVASVAAAIRKTLGPRKINYGAYGDTGCHLHFHLVPKYENDPFEWGGVFAMNPGRKFLSREEYAELIGALGAELTVGTTFDLRKALVELSRGIRTDGRVDFYEATFLLKALAPLAASDVRIAAFVKVLRETRADGVITDDESGRILGMLDDLVK